MNIGETLKKSFDILRNNTLLILPPIMAMIIIYSLRLIVSDGGVSITDIDNPETGDYQGMERTGGGPVLISFLIMTASMLIQTVAHGTTIAMANDILRSGSTSLRQGLSTAFGRILSLIIASILIGLLTGFGFMLFFIPGLIVFYFLMFSLVIIIADNAGPLEAIVKSYRTTKNNFSDTVSIYLVLAGLFLLTILANTFIGMIPLIGHFINAVLTGGLIAYISIALLLTYNSIRTSEAGGKKEDS